MAAENFDLRAVLAELRSNSVAVSLPASAVLLDRSIAAHVAAAVTGAQALFTSSHFTKAWVLLDAEVHMLTLFLRLTDANSGGDGLPIEQEDVQARLGPPLLLMGAAVQGPRAFSTGLELEVILPRREDSR
jgi:hypothetical protein